MGCTKHINTPKGVFEPFCLTIYLYKYYINNKMTSGKVILISVLFVFCLKTAAAQLSLDSINKILLTAKNDTAKVNLLVRAGRTALFRPINTFTFGDQIIAISKKIDYPIGLVNGYRLNGAYYSEFRNDIPKGLKYYQMADSICRLYQGPEFTEGLGAVQYCYGNIQLHIGNTAQALQYYIKALQILERINSKQYLMRTYNNLANAYLFMNILDKAEYYEKKCLKTLEETNDSNILPYANVTMADILIEQKKFKEALPFIFKAKELGLSSENYTILYFSYFNLGRYYGAANDFNQAIHCTLKAKEYEEKIGNPLFQARIENNLSYFYVKNNQIKEANFASHIAYHLSDSLKFNDIKYSSLRNMALSEAHLGRYKQAYEYLVRSYELKDSFLSVENYRQINNLEALYQNEKKENEINELKKEQKISALLMKKKNLTNYALFVTLVLFLGIAFYINRNIRHKRNMVKKENEVQKHKIRELENERLLMATQSVLIGEENERKRLARDLHDGLGGLLSSVKTSLNAVKGNVLLSNENVNNFNQALVLLDSSITELRSVAHNMMPEALVKLGLKDTLADFCNEINIANPMQIDFQFYGQFKRVNSNLEINIYRIIQELVNNAIKHSEAKELVVQMIQEENRLCFIVLDDGKGFDPKIMEHCKGIGLASLQSRVNSFNGQIEINSRQGKGTEITIEFPI
jgi:two-component system, NarL family, sensor kinase